MKRFLVFVLFLAVLGACAQQDDAGQQAAEGDGFMLSGRVVEVDEGAEADDVPEPPEQEGADAGPGTDVGDDEGAAEEPGSLLVDSKDDIPSELEGCTQDEDGFTVFYTEETRFSPGDVVGDDDFPDSLEDASVTVNGTFYQVATEDDDPSPTADETDCTLVAQTVTVEQDAPDGEGPMPRETFTPGPRSPSPDAGASPEASPLETSEATPNH